MTVRARSSTAAAFETPLLVHIQQALGLLDEEPPRGLAHDGALDHTTMALIRCKAFVENAKELSDARVSAWIPCSERMPEAETRVLIVISGRVAIGSWMPGDDLWPVTHWQPLPSPPAKDP